MKRETLTVPALAIQTLRRRPFRTACLLVITALLAFSLFGGSVLTRSLQNGMNSTEQRLGADLMVVPEGYEADAEGILLKGEPNYFYFSRAVLQKVAAVPGVSKVTAQFFLTSLSASCCSAQVQLISFDPDTDFVIRPWIAQAYGGAIGDGELIAGGGIELEDGHTLRFFGRSFPVAAQLAKTATGLDSSVFMNRETMGKLLEAAQAAGVHFVSDAQLEDAASAVLVKAGNGYDFDALADRIRDAVPDVDVVVSKSMIAAIAASLGSLLAFVRVLTAVIWIFALLVLFLTFSIAARERKKEFAVLRVLGATRGRLVRIVLTEALVASILGGAAGTALASVTVFPFSAYIGDRLQLPFLMPHIGALAGVLVLSFLLVLAVGPLASAYSAVKISRAETYLTMREGE